MNTSIKGIAMCAAATVVAVTFVAAVQPAGAQHQAAPHDAPQGFVYEDWQFGRFYENPAEGIVVTAGIPVEQFCLQTDLATAPMRVLSNRDGTDTLKVRGERNVSLYAYQFAGPGPALIGLTCEAIFDDDPATEPPQPWAVGEGLYKETVTGIEGPEDLGGFAIENWINGHATATDGTQWRVKGEASFEFDEDGIPIGDPAEFQGVWIQQIRRGR